MNDDFELLRAYSEGGSEGAFAELVERYKGLVYASALRQTGNAALAEEITQAVFVVLAQKADRIKTGTILSGWLFRATRYAACDVLKAERRRVHREQETLAMNSQSQEPEAHEEGTTWQQIAPVLDESMGRLGEGERHALLLRFFERKNLADVGRTLGISEEAARKKVSRALEKLRKLLGARGVAVPAIVLGSVLAANAAPAAPITLGVSVGAGSASAPLVKTILALMAWSKTKIAIISGAALLLGTGTTVLTLSAFRHMYRQVQEAKVVPPPAIAPRINSLVIPQEVVISPISTTTSDAEGFSSIFNGVDLQGWSYNPHVWSVVDGAMTGRIAPEVGYNLYCIAWSGGQVSDFELRLRFRTGGLANSGVAVRSRWAQQRYFPGYQVEIHGPRTALFIIAGAGRERQLCREGFRTIASEKDGMDTLELFEPLADLARINEARAAVEEGEWCELAIVAKDRHFTTRLNGLAIVDTMDDQPEKFVARGQIGFEYTHRKGIEDFVQFKDIRFKRLEPVPGPQARNE